jgi:hypothetical protein
MMLPLLLLTLALAAPDKPAAPKPRPSEKPRVYTNDDLEGYKEQREQEGPATPTPTPPPSEGRAPAPEGDEGGVIAGQIETVRRAREALAEAEKARDAARARVESIESSLNPMSVEFESDPNITLRLQAELPEAREALAAAEASVESARTDLQNAEELAKGGRLRPPAGAR